MELKLGEEFFINVCRNFDFLRYLDYEGNNFCLIGREIWVSFLNPRINIKITVIMEEPFVLNIYFEKNNFLKTSKFSLRDHYRKFGVTYLEKTNDIGAAATFIKQDLMPIIIGEKWIDDFVKK